jgi:hypothetical protein
MPPLTYINTLDTAHDKGWEKDHEAGLAEGMEKGREERNVEIAIKMKTDGVSADIIAKYTRLTPEEVAALS